MLESMNKSVEHSQTSQQAVKSVDDSFGQIKNNIDHLAVMISSIATTSEEQGYAANEIAQSTALINEGAQTNTQDIYKVIDVIESMNEVIINQLKSLEKFKIPYRDLILAKSDHLMWKKRLTELLLGRVNIRPEEVSDHHHCRLGKWYYGIGMQNYGHIPEFSKLEEPHAQVHAMAREIVKLHEQQQDTQALAKLRQLEGLTTTVINSLERLRYQVSGQ